MTELQYIQTGDYYIPNLTLERGIAPIGRYGRMRKAYLREHHPILYNSMVLSGALYLHLLDIQQAAERREEVLTARFKQQRGLTEERKAEDFMGWVGEMNNIRGCVEEIIFQKLIYCEEQP